VEFNVQNVPMWYPSPAPLTLAPTELPRARVAIINSLEHGAGEYILKRGRLKIGDLPTPRRSESLIGRDFFEGSLRQLKNVVQA
jgi:hypothetical protein